MNTVIFVVYRKHRPWYVALCACGTAHGRYPAVALIPPQCLGCEQKALMECPRTVYTDLNGLICKMKVTLERSVTFDTAALFERPAEVGQDPQR